MSEHYYFKVTGGKIQNSIDEWNALRLSQYNARNAVKKSFGASGMWGSSSDLLGLVFDPKSTKKPPAHWKEIKGEATVWKPHGSSKEANADRAKMKNLPLASLATLTQKIAGDSWHFLDGRVIRYVHFETIGDVTILKVPFVGNQKKLWESPDEFCIPLKASEYWLLKEQQEKPTSLAAA